MPLDPYQNCPCGSGKKIKFCCRDLADEMETISRMLEGDQRLACLEHVESLEKKFPDRAYLLSLRTLLEIEFDRLDAAEQTAARFLSLFPDNPVALASSAAMKLERGELPASVDLLHQAIEKCRSSMPTSVYQVLDGVTRSLIESGQIVAGHAHVMLQFSISGNRDRDALQLLLQVNDAPQLTLLEKTLWRQVDCPDDATWKKDFDEALDAADSGNWRTGLAKFESLVERAGDHAALWKNIGVLRTRLLKPDAAEALRKHASLDVPLDDAVEAEALAQLLDQQSGAELDRVDLLNLVYPIVHEEQLVARLHAEPCILPLNIDPASVMEEGQPPPRAAYSLVDRPLPESGVDVARDAVPLVEGDVFLFGKQTDREARLELSLVRSERLDDLRRRISEVAGDALGGAPQEEVVQEVPAEQAALNRTWRFPPDTPPEHRRRLIAEQHREAVFERWTALKMGRLGGKSPAEAAGDESLRTRVLAAVLLLENAHPRDGLDYNQLRSRLGLPTCDPIDPRGREAKEFPLMRLARLQVESFSDDQLVRAYTWALGHRADEATQRFALEVVRREIVHERIDLSQVYGTLAQLADDSAQSLSYLDQARSAAETAGESSAQWDLTELTIRIERFEGDQVARLVDHINQQHIREPGIAEALVQILVRAGILNPDGSMRRMPKSQPSGLIVPGDSQGDGSRIITPDGEPAAASGEKKVIWTPD